MNNQNAINGLARKVDNILVHYVGRKHRSQLNIFKSKQESMFVLRKRRFKSFLKGLQVTLIFKSGIINSLKPFGDTDINIEFSTVKCTLFQE